MIYDSVKGKAGIYFIKNIINKKVYIGQSLNCRKRLIHHKHELIQNKHSNPHLQNSFNKNGIDNFKCGVIEYCDNLTDRERFYINNQSNEIYNIREASDSVKHQQRVPISEETRQKLKKARAGKSPTNLKWLQQKNRRKINYYIHDILIKQFESCKDAASYFGLKSNVFHQYIGKSRNTKKFPKGYRIEYAESKERRYVDE